MSRFAAQCWLTLSLITLGAAGLAGCAAPGPVFPEVSPPIVWPVPPDAPRIRYVGALIGQESLRKQPQGLAAVGAVLTGQTGQVRFVRPSAVAVRGDVVFVADLGLGAVHRLDLNSRDYRLLRRAGNEAWLAPIDLAIITVRGEARLAVLDRQRAVCDVLSLSGEFLASHAWPQIAAPVALADDPQAGCVWIADAKAHAIFAWKPDSDATPAQYGQRGTSPGMFNFPSALAADAAVGLVVADAMNFRVQVLNHDFTVRSAFGQRGDAAGDFARPRAVAVDSDGHIYVLDNQFENVQIFRPDGTLLMAFGEGGDGPGQFSLPSGITIDAQDRIWVADSYNRRVQVFQYLTEKVSWAAAG